MGKLAVLRNILLLIVLVGVVLMVSHFAEPVKNMTLRMFHLENASVLGASSERAKEITEKVGSDLGKQFEVAKDEVLNVKLGDIITTLSRAQRIPHDIQIAGEFLMDQADALTDKK